MNRFGIILTLLFVQGACAQERTVMVSKTRQDIDADWLVVGGGPAGIATVGVLLDIGISPDRLIWLDPEFNVGRLGQYYTHVPANSYAKEFIELVKACAVFTECSSLALDHVCTLDPEEHYELSAIVTPLQDITDYLRTKIPSVQDYMTSLYFTDNAWHVGTASGAVFDTNHVVLATGCHPKSLDYESQKVIPLDEALDRYKLEKQLTPNDSVGVVGSAHSAVLLLKFLTEMSFPLAHIYNFWRNPIVYVIHDGEVVYNSLTGIKGVAADWARNILEANPPKNLTRIQITPDTFPAGLKDCSKVIYAVGYEQNSLPAINDETPITAKDGGMIAPRLFGIGIAFPEKVTDQHGVQGHSIGLDRFMDYAQRAIPEWVNNPLYKDRARERAIKQRKKLAKLQELFTIYQL